MTFFLLPLRVKIFSPQRGGSAVIRLSVCKHRMQKQEIFKAEPKGMQINYVYIFLTDSTSTFQRGEKSEERESISSRSNISEDGRRIVFEADTLTWEFGSVDVTRYYGTHTASASKLGTINRAANST